MRAAVFCLFFASVAALSFLAYADAAECSPGETRREDCNTCTCTKGGLFACTRRLCLHKREAAQCSPGETKQEDCNTCRCTRGGIFVCTRKQCIGKREAQQQECSPGQTKQQQCNTCTCTERGIFVCTQKFCLGKREAIAAGRVKRDDHVADEMKTTPCAPGDYFKVQCNTCYCRPDGNGYLCTKNICNGDDFAEPYSTTFVPYDYKRTIVISSSDVKVARDSDVYFNMNPDTWAERTSDVALRTPDFNTLDNSLSTNAQENLGVGKAAPLEEILANQASSTPSTSSSSS